MDFHRKDEGYSIIPKKDLKCIWMTAGLISYKLCKYDLQCDRCPLDWELRNLSSHSSLDPGASGEDQEEECLKSDLSLLSIKESLFYHPGHTWIKVERADEVRVGIDYFLGSLLKKVNVVVLPLSGRRAVQGATLCSIIQEEGILYIVFPVSGLILSINQKLKDQPELIRKDPLGEGFLLTLKPKNLQRDQKYLFSGEEALSWCRKEWERFKETIISELRREQGELGMTMQDGGIALRALKNLVGPGRYIQLLNSFLRKGEQFLPGSKEKGEVDSSL
jgi:glycine cleavage system H protein